MQEKISNSQLAAGYITTAYASTAPAWAHDMEVWLSITAVGFGVLVGATTLYLNLAKIIAFHRKKRKLEELEDLEEIVG